MASWNGNAARSRWFDALSLLLPAAERFAVRALTDWRAAAHATADVHLLAQAKRFIDDELAHQRVHDGYNRRLLEHRPQAAPLADAGARVADGLAALPLRTRLALTVAFEHLTAALAFELLAHRHLLDDGRSRQARIWRWHAQEELAHCHVAAAAAAAIGIDRRHIAPALLLAALLLGVDLWRLWAGLCRCDVAAGESRTTVARDAIVFLWRGIPSGLRMVATLFRDALREPVALAAQATARPDAPASPGSPRLRWHFDGDGPACWRLQ